MNNYILHQTYVRYKKLLRSQKPFSSKTTRDIVNLAAGNLVNCIGRT